MKRLLTLLSILVSASTSSRAIECAALKAEIDQKIKATAVTNYTLVVADASASAPGRLVGNCENGTKKIYYLPAAATGGGAQSQRAAASATSGKPTAATRADVMLTECKPGYSGADCKTRGHAP